MAVNQENVNELPAKETKNLETADHLLLVVHGIGDHEEKWKKKIPAMKKNRDELYTSFPNLKKTEIVAIEWYKIAHAFADDKISQITPPGLEALRTFANSTILDIFYALSPHYAPLIYKEIRDQLNKAYLDYKRENPKFKGKVSILAHSLGSFIVYDILTLQKSRKQTKSKYDSITYEELKLKKEQAIAEKDESMKEEVKMKFKKLDADKRNVRFWKRMVYQGVQKSSVKDLLEGLDLHKSILPSEFSTKLQLEFEVDNYFLIGSPASMFLTVRGDMENEMNFPACKNIYNIMHPYDPVSYRLEPYIDTRYGKLEPETLPAWDQPTGKRLSTRIVEHWTKPKKKGLTDEDLEAVRYDYLMQLSIRNPTNWLAYTSLAPAHSSYWGSKDVMYFILEKITSVDAKQEA